MSVVPFQPEGVFFDLDGTLLDSALDLYAALVDLCAEEGVVPPPYENVRPVVSRGSRAIIGAGFPGIANDALRPLTAVVRSARMAAVTAILHSAWPD